MPDNEVNEVIFGLILWPACGVTEHTCQSGEITSPNFPDYYPPNLNCNYNVYASTESSMTFTFMYLDTEEDVDFVTVSIG